jgi:hypothetical protein
LATAAAGTYLTGFSVTLNNHTVAAFCGFFALYPALLIWLDDRRSWWLFASAGFFASLTAVLELPALAFAAILLLALAWKGWDVRSLSALVAFAVVPLAAHCFTNYQVTSSIMPAYEKKDWYVFEGSYWKLDSTGRLVGSSKDPVTGELIIGDPSGIDNQFEPWYVYLFHMWLGHHGVFSLTPVLLFVGIGLARALKQADQWTPFAFILVGLTILLAGFYTMGPAFGYGQRNYGGMCNGMRWLFWLIPLWLVFLPKGLEWKVNCRGTRSVAIVLLMMSVASAFYASRNPWTRPWLQELLHQAGWLGY